jgi:DNA-binding CsgD family transcriptional regulator
VTDPGRMPDPGATIDSVSEYARGLQEELRKLRGNGPEEWREAIDRGLGEAFQRRDMPGLVEIVKIGVSILDAAGRGASAASQITHALNIAKDDPGSMALLSAWRGCFLGACGHTSEALEDAARAERAIPGVSDARAASEASCHAMAIRLLALETVSLETVDRLVHLTGEGPTGAAQLFLSSYHIPLLYACGQRSEVAPRQESFRLAAQAARHEWRLADAAVFSNAERALHEPITPPSLDSISPWNWVARWRLQLLRFRAAHLRGNVAEAEVELEALLELKAAAGDADLDPSDAFQAFERVHRDPGGFPVQVEPPRTVHLMNLPSILAGAEAVAIGGSQALANQWLSWLNRFLPPRIETSLEWPVSRARIEALLALRNAEPRRANELLEKAAEWADQAGYPCELAIARVQIAELHLHHDPNPSRTSAALTTKQSLGWEDLRSRGIEPARFAYQVARLSAWTKGQSLHARLTPREIEVLALLAEGLTYKQIGQAIGVKWPTVQVFAHHCYEKLEAPNRAAAVLAAREQGIL